MKEFTPTSPEDRMPRWHKTMAPKFKIGQTVYYVKWDDNCPAAMKGKRWAGEQIIAIQAKLLENNDGKVVFVCSGYELPGFRFDRDDGDSIYHFCELYETEEAVKRVSEWFPVEGITDEEWMKLTGQRGDLDDEVKALIAETKRRRPWVHHLDGVEPIEIGDSELGVCCANVSHVRDMLIKCYRHGGLIRRDIESMVINMRGCGPDPDKDDLSKTHPILHRVLAQLPVAEVEKDE